LRAVIPLFASVDTIFHLAHCGPRQLHSQSTATF
jgi:hypothetical protein